MYVKQADGSVKEEYVDSSIPEDVFQSVHQQNLQATILKSEQNSMLLDLLKKQKDGTLTDGEKSQLDYLDPQSRLKALKEKQTKGKTLSNDEKAELHMVKQRVLRVEFSDAVHDYQSAKGKAQLKALHRIREAERKWRLAH